MNQNLNLTFYQKEIDAEKTIIEIANEVYTSLDLKPISKTIFFISRVLLIMSQHKINNSKDLIEKYNLILKELKNKKKNIADDFNFSQIVTQNKDRLNSVINKLNYIYSLSLKSDVTGLVFNSLLRGKFEAGEGLGTFLTPEEVVNPVNEMLLLLCYKNNKKINGPIGDIAGGTGRFLYSLKNKIQNFQKIQKKFINSKFYLYDISNMSVSLAKINFYIEKLYPNFITTKDSLTDISLNKFKNSFSLLATNPPFGIGKYGFNKNLLKTFDIKTLKQINFFKDGQKIDPAELFFIKNIDLLGPEGVLGIVLPDGICKTEKLNKLLSVYNNRSYYINKIAVISLPSHTFSLGGTVAQSSFLIFEKSKKKRNQLFSEKAENIGYLKRGNFKVIDDKGNDLLDIVIKFQNFLKYDYDSLQNKKNHIIKNPLKKYLFIPENFHDKKFSKTIHVSILDIDKSGLIDINQSLKNTTVTKPKTCRPNDILISCINPRKWRLVLIPNLPYNFTCSPEFVVLRAKSIKDSKKICLSLFSHEFKKKFIEMGKGTSSSRQRVSKNLILDLSLPKIQVSDRDADNFFKKREKYYLERIEEEKFLSRF